jgi:hypothetical protein
MYQPLMRPVIGSDVRMWWEADVRHAAEEAGKLQKPRLACHMDFSGLLLIPLAALITAVWIVCAAALSSGAASLRKPFLLSYSLGVLFMQPWLIASWQEAGMVAVMLVMLLLWIAGGCIIGAMPAMAVVALTRRLTRPKP